MSEIEFLARQAAIQASNPGAVGNLIERIEEAEPGVVTYKFDSKLKGYVGWHWSVSLFFENDQVSISEVNLVAGENSILAPQWVPWSERLADYKALQAALEEQAAEEAAAAAAEQQAAAEAEVVSEEQTVEEDDFEEVEEIEETSATGPSGLPESEQAEDDSEDTGGNEVSFFRIFRRGKKRK
ncbi:MAG: DUF3027 domain-containing protein [Micrococcales bacterium]